MRNETDAETIARLELQRDKKTALAIELAKTDPLAALVAMQNSKAIRAQLWAVKWGARQADQLVVDTILEESR